ncbi:MAG: shikimate dehydrogenase, partial [Rhodospirillaceae bacterium]|nr:shikimate dehydrogenase [Rhodospirillaceae bacterium]
MTLKAGVMGWPVDHSRSPALHGFWLKTLGIDGSYVRLPVKPENLTEALRDLPRQGFAGVNLTVPHKEAAMAVVDEISPEARRIGAVNTV